MWVARRCHPWTRNQELKGLYGEDTPDPLSLLVAEYNLEDHNQFLKTFGSSLGDLLDFLLKHRPQLLAGLTAIRPALLERLPILDSVELLVELLS